MQRFVEQEKAERLSLRTLETLSVIAYKQPVTAAEIQEIRGVDPSGTIRTLLDKSLIKIAGRKKEVEPAAEAAEASEAAEEARERALQEAAEASDEEAPESGSDEGEAGGQAREADDEHA